MGAHMAIVADDVPKSIPTTGRTPDFLAKRYGFDSLDELIEDIPRRAVVLDVGAGLSLLGHAVANQRPDVTWFNIDPYYQNEHTKKASIDAPSNVRYVARDITQSVPELAELQAARIFSYWVLPHISLTGDAPAERAVGAMWDKLTPDGVMYVGPDRPYRLGSLGRTTRHVRIAKTTPKTEAVKLAVDITRLPLWMRAFQHAVNRYLRPVANIVLIRLADSQMRRARQKIRTSH
jgi:hypothetical protein